MSDALLFIVMALASHRLWRFVGLDEWPPMRRMRSEIELRANRSHEAFMAGEDGRGFWRSWLWGELQTFVECPWCLGSWVAFAVVAIVAQIIPIAFPVLWALAVACVVGLIGSNLDG